MTFPDTISAWMSETPPVPDCPSWCTKADGHCFIAFPEPGVLDVDRNHVAFRAGVVEEEGARLTVLVYAHETYNADEGL